LLHLLCQCRNPILQFAAQIGLLRMADLLTPRWNHGRTSRSGRVVSAPMKRTQGEGRHAVLLMFWNSSRHLSAPATLIFGSFHAFVIFEFIRCIADAVASFVPSIRTSSLQISVCSYGTDPVLWSTLHHSYLYLHWTTYSVQENMSTFIFLYLQERLRRSVSSFRVFVLQHLKLALATFNLCRFFIHKRSLRKHSCCPWKINRTTTHTVCELNISDMYLYDDVGRPKCTGSHLGLVRIIRNQNLKRFPVGMLH
jgi:hypothetical protein